jgi:tRNA(Ile)-lysidine synthase TilS/MesJ
MISNIIDASYLKFLKLIENKNLFDGVSKFVLLFSGGKDCSMLIDLFLRYYDENKLKQEFKIFSSPFPKHMYFDAHGNILENFASIKNYWAARDIVFEYRTPDHEDFSDDDKFGCKICKKARKSEIDNYLNSLGQGIGVLTGFTMYDSLAYMSMLLLTCDFDLSNMANLPEDKRITMTKMFHKMSLREHLPSDIYFLRPMLPFNEIEVREYLKVKQIPFLTTPCKISKYKFKRLYSYALDLYSPLPATYDGIERFLLANGIQINNNGLSFDDVAEENFFIDC